MNIEKVAVIGAGVMGGSIAAHVSNAGFPVYLLDIVPGGAENRNIITETAIRKMLDAEPSPFMEKRNARLITPGNIEDHLSWLADADWVIEAVTEDIAIKQSLYRRLDQICRADAVISSNTSSLPLHLLVTGMPVGFQQRFLISHFFNPPRYMRLLELVAGPRTRPELYAAIQRFADVRLGKECIPCKDTPGFIVNRIGIYWLHFGLLEALRLDVTVEEADAVISMAMATPKTGIFGLLDLIGIDLLPPVLGGMGHSLPAEDAFHQINVIPPLIHRMIAEGHTGRKGGGGFYRLHETHGKRIKESIDLASGIYRPSEKPVLESIRAGARAGIHALLIHPDKFGGYAWDVLSHTLNYAARLVPEIADDIVAVDAAIRLGLNWQYGPFELLDRIGIDWYVDRLGAEGMEVPPLLQTRPTFYRVDEGRPVFLDLSGEYRPIARAEGVLLLSDLKVRKPSVLSNRSASLWDIGDGVACLEFHSKMNTLDMDTMSLIEQSIDRVGRDFAALLIYNESEHFSVGANLNLLIAAIDQGDWAAVSGFIERGQQAYKALKYAPFPVVGAPSGRALGGGCEILLHCDAIQAHAELYMGLVETGVGLIPGWGGCKEYLKRRFAEPKRLGGPIPPIVKAFETIGMAKISRSAFEARELRYLSGQDGITMNRNRLLADAKTRALALCADYRAPEPDVYELPGKTGRIVLSMALKGAHMLGKITAYDVTVGQSLAEVLSGGDCDMTEALSEDDLLALEKQAFLDLVKRPETRARIEHVLQTGRPLRN
jgi:3-hydroxyacyl-CoA dehydrogenase